MCNMESTRVAPCKYYLRQVKQVHPGFWQKMIRRPLLVHVEYRRDPLVDWWSFQVNPIFSIVRLVQRHLTIRRLVFQSVSLPEAAMFLIPFDGDSARMKCW